MNNNKSGKKNNWLKLKIDFFSNLQTKKLRKIAGGDTFLIIYQKIMLLTVNSEGHYYHQQIESTIEEELALILDEDIENIRMTLAFCISTKLIENVDNTAIYLNEVPKLIGKADDSSERVAKYRALKRVSQECNALHDRYKNVTVTNVTALEKDKERDIDKEVIDKSITKKKNLEKFFDCQFTELENIAINEFIQHRKDIKKKLTDLAKTKIINKLFKLKAKNYNICTLIDNSILAGYPDIYEPRDFKKETAITKTRDKLKYCNGDEELGSF